MIGILVAVLLAALVYWLCVMLGLPAIVGIVAAILVLLAGVGTGGYGYRRRGGRRLCPRRRRGRARRRHTRRARDVHRGPQARVRQLPRAPDDRLRGDADVLRDDVPVPGAPARRHVARPVRPGGPRLRRRRLPAPQRRGP